jgi:4-amino-4-deoxy-L-arabinose transferase-like glycosyltransferase
VFDALACTVGAALIYTLVRFIRDSRQAKQNLPETSLDGKVSWFSAHTEALCIVVLLVFSTVFFVYLGSDPLWAADEQTYSQWAFHMFKTGEYLEPWGFGGPALWIGKPPFFMWLMSLSYQLFGVNNFATRFWNPIFGALSLVLVFYLGKKLYNLPVGFLSAVVLGTFNLFFMFSRHAMTDVPFTFFVVASLYFMVLSEKTEHTKHYVVLSGLFFGLALMTKQIIALLIPIIAFVYFLATQRSIKMLFTRRFAWFWGVALLIVSPWVVYMTLRFGPEFWRIFLVYSNFTRAATAIEGHAGGYLFYLTYLVNNDNLLWVVLLPFSVGLCLFNSIFKRAKEDTLILVWMAVVVGLFTVAQTKLEWYILPAVPAFAVAIGSFLYILLKKVPGVMRFLLAKAQEIVGIVMSRTRQ